MCGIAGIFYVDTAKPVDPLRIQAMTEAQAHRGPDGSGIWTSHGIGLGHRRLSVIDIEAGAQPMLSDDGTITVTFNGEIYNFRDLRRELEVGGAEFLTGSDTETLIHGWRAWGPAMLERLDGMFAFALYDETRRALFLARDRLGVKPLHYAYLPDGSIAFASELKGLLANRAIRREPSVQAVEDYFALGYVPDDACIVSGVEKLAAGHFLWLHRGQAAPPPQRWWDLDFSRRSTASISALEGELVQLLKAAVKSRMVADVPLGAFLSGGADSSSVVALMADIGTEAMHSASIGFDDPALDESAFAAAVAARFATDHRARMVSSNDFAAIDPLVAAFDEPFADASALPTLRLCQLARETVTVALSGDGADELFAGYRRYRFQGAEERARSLLPDTLLRTLGAVGARYPRAEWAPRPLRARATLQALGRDGGEAYARSVGVTDPETRAALFSSALTRDLQGHRAEDRYVATMRDAPACEPLDRAQYADVKIALPGDILTKTDRMGMSVGLEVREPLLDHRLAEFAARLPANMRLRRGEGKWLMKRAMRPYLPADILYRRKMGFVTPLADWFRGPLAQEAERVCARLPETGWFDPKFLSELVPDHRSGNRDQSRLLWQLVMFEKAMTRLFGQ